MVGTFRTGWGAQLEEASLLLSDATARESLSFTVHSEGIPNSGCFEGLKATAAEIKTAPADAPKAAPSAEVTSMKAHWPCLAKLKPTT